MTDYERGFLACREMAAQIATDFAAADCMTPEEVKKHLEAYEYHTLQGAIRSLQPEAGADQREAAAGPCVSVPREPKKGLLCGDVAISTDPRYAGWVFVRHVDGINWTTGAKLTPETWAMLAAAKEEGNG